MNFTVPEAVWAGVLLFGLRQAWTIYWDYQKLKSGHRLADYVSLAQCEKSRAAVLGEATAKCALCSAAVEDRLRSGEDVFEAIRRDKEWTRAALALLVRKADISLEEIEREIKLNSGGNHG